MAGTDCVIGVKKQRITRLSKNLFLKKFAFHNLLQHKELRFLEIGKTDVFRQSQHTVYGSGLKPLRVPFA